MGNTKNEIKKELEGKTGMSPELEADLFERIAQIEECKPMIQPMTKADLVSGLALAVVCGILPVVFVGLVI